jgi:RNA polymerase sigma-70 factor (ECF subfamily)
VSDRRAGFSRLYDAHYASILGYAMRRTEEIRLWLYGVARKVLANHHRSRRRRGRLADELRQHATTSGRPEHPAAGADDGAAIATAFANLRAGDRELLLLAAWEGLEPAGIAQVLGITGVAARVRLHRARQRFAVHLATTGVLQPQEKPCRHPRPLAAPVAARPGSEETS